MIEKLYENNQTVIAGEFISEFIYSHETFAEKFYTVYISVPRQSGSADILPVTVPERLFDINLDCRGFNALISGQLRSYDKQVCDGLKTKLVLSVFAKEIKLLDELPDSSRTNTVTLDGYICKPPIYRKTPLGREISDLLLAVNRSYGKSDYIPCICWGRNAKYMETRIIGDQIKVIGRIQSREYQKKISEAEAEIRIAYEVSVSRLEH